MTRIALACPCLIVLLLTVPGPAAVAQNEAVHDALRALKQQAEDAFNAAGRSGDRADLDRLLELVDDNVVLAAMNGRFAIGKSGIVDYFDSTMKGPNRTVQSVHQTFDVAALTTLYGSDTGVAHGTSTGTYELTNGMSFTVHANWTATMVNEDGRWLLASFQFAPSIFDNPVLDQAVSALYWGIGIAGVAGLVLGFLIGRLAGRRRKEAT